MKKTLALFLVFSILSSCTTPPPPTNYKELLQADAPKIKNVILMIGDGMGPQQVAIAELYAKYAPHSVVKNRQLALTQFLNSGYTGIVFQNPHGNLIIDSACSATQMATGVPSGSEMIGVDFKGNRAETILEKAEKMGLSTGLVSDTRITHATPASFISHVAHRSMENDIAEQMITSGADVLLSGGIQYFVPKSGLKDESVFPSEFRGKIKSKRNDEKNLLQQAQQQQYQLAFNLAQMKPVKSGKILGLFTPSGMPDGIENTQTKNDAKRTIPTLQEMTEKALEVLAQNDKGFFLMVEGGQIDWGGHANDAAWILHDMLKFDDAIKVVMNWASKRNDTLVIVTADHETGSFGFSYQASDLPTAQHLSGDAFVGKEFLPAFNFGRYTVLDQIYNQKKTFNRLLEEFNKLDKTQQTPEELQKLVAENTSYKISTDEARAILEDESNQFYVEGHKELGIKSWARIDDFDSFYVYGENRRSAKMARILASREQVVWGSGTHTTTPVIVGAIGPKNWAENFKGILRGYDIGNIAIKALGLK